MITIFAAFIVNVGTMMQPNAGNTGSGPPPSYTAIATGSGAILATGNGTYIITH